MEEFEKVEELVRATGVSYEDAKNAIRACEGNIVDAVSYLEKLGKFDPKAEKRTAPNYEEKCRKAFIEAKKPAGKFVDFLTKNKLDIKKGDDTVASVPVGAAAALCLISAPVTLSAAFVSMMCGCDYSFKGENNKSMYILCFLPGIYAIRLRGHFSIPGSAGRKQHRHHKYKNSHPHQLFLHIKHLPSHISFEFFISS